MAHIVLQQYTSKELVRKWGKHAWTDMPAHIVTIPFPEGVLFGVEQRYNARRVSFFLTIEDCRILGERLLNAAQEAENAVS